MKVKYTVGLSLQASQSAARRYRRFMPKRNRRCMRLPLISSRMPKAMQRIICQKVEPRSLLTVEFTLLPEKGRLLQVMRLMTVLLSSSLKAWMP